MRDHQYFLLYGACLCLLFLVACTGSESADASRLAKNAASKLVGLKEEAPRSGPGEFAFFSFLQKLTNPSEEANHFALEKEAALFFPDSTLHAGYALHGLEIPYLDSIRLLYYEFSKNSPPESRAYLGVFSKTGRALDVLPLKEATYDGSAAVTLIDQSTLELEYYDVYDQEGYLQEVLSFEYYDLNPDGQLRVLSRPERVSEERKYLEASLRLLSKSELKRYRPRELRLMQMEVLADYGQKFESPKWNRYFSQKDWYTPRHDQVEHLLSDLERVNLEKIVAMQRAY